MIDYGELGNEYEREGIDGSLGKMYMGGASGEIELVFSEEGEIQWGELTEFMYLFRGWYVLASERLGTNVTPQSLVQNFNDILSDIQGDELEAAFFQASREGMGRNDLRITRVNKESPLIIWALCIPASCNA